jgi:hypothetical protein
MNRQINGWFLPILSTDIELAYEFTSVSLAKSQKNSESKFNPASLEQIATEAIRKQLYWASLMRYFRSCPYLDPDWWWPDVADTEESSRILALNLQQVKDLVREFYHD